MHEDAAQDLRHGTKNLRHTGRQSGVTQNIPIFGDIFGPFTGGSGTDIPLIKVGSDLLGAGTAIAKQKPQAKAKALLKSAEAAATIFAGKPGTAQAFDLIERILLPESKGGGSGRVELGPQ